MSSLSEGNVVYDEIKMYYDVRSLSPYEAVWRIFGFEINYRKTFVKGLFPSITRLEIVIYEDNDDLDDVLNRNTFKQTMFQAWMAANKKYKEAKELVNSEFPPKFVFKKDTQEWDPKNQDSQLGDCIMFPQELERPFT
ncbi:hypothetical protein K1719_042100 [Acacia pycnantha]|nr:hypothetical protein K1719_042100 [Acacia pycnantha]